MDETNGLRRLAEMRVGILATVRPGGGPHIVPVVFAVLAGDIVTAIDDKPKRTTRLQRLSNIRANPRVSVLAHEYSEDWVSLWWVRADGMAEILEEGARYEHAVSALRAKYDQYREQPPSGPVIAITLETVSTWDATPNHPE